MLNQVKVFGSFRNFIWPIHRYELKKFFPMLAMFFLISFDYNVLRTMKDTLVVTAQGSGAEVIPFIKVWAMFPGAVLMTFIFTWLSNKMTQERVFYVIMSFFLGYFFLFIIFLFPNHEYLHQNPIADFCESILPVGCKGLIAMLRNWTFTLFYVMSELWGNIVLIVLLWGFVNQVTKIEEARRFYGLFGLGANLSGIIAGQVSVALSAKAFDPSLPFGNTAWEQSLHMLLALVLVGGVLTIILYRWINLNVLTDDRFYCTKTAHQETLARGKLSLTDSFRHLFRSRYLISIAIVVVAYNVAINLVEVLWKDQVRMLYPNPGEYNRYTNQVATIIGIVATFSAVLVSSNSIRRFGWTFTALITPVILLITSVGFFALIFGQGALEATGAMFFGMTPLMLIVFMGAFQNILSRGAKYTVFDATKEMAFVPLSPDSKVKGKAAIDGIFNRMGKSGGSVIHQGLLVVFASFAATAPYIAAILFLIIGGWIVAVRTLGKDFNALTGSGKKAQPEPVVAPSARPISSEPALSTR